MTDLKTLKQLIRLMVENDLTELDLEGEGEKIKLKRGRGEVQYIAPPTAAAPVAVPAASSASPARQPDAPADNADEGLAPIASPMVGTFYAAPSPDAKPFVAVGDRVDAETVVCIVEAMKVFNEIKAETTGVIEKVLIESGQSVEFGQPLFLIRPD